MLETLFDQIARGRRDGADARSDDGAAMRGRCSTGFIAVFSNFWAKNRLLLKRIHGIAAVDPEFGKAIQARNQRRQMAATRVIERLGDGVRGRNPRRLRAL